MDSHQIGYQLKLIYLYFRLFFLVYINDLSDKVTTTVKLFADDTSLFSVVNDPNISGYELHKDLENQFQNGYTNEKCLLILIRINRHKKLFSL